MNFRIGFAGGSDAIRAVRLGAVLALGFCIVAAAGAQTQTAKTMPVKAHPKADLAASAVPNKTIGNKSAPITMEVFSDYECPSCGNFYESTLKTMIQTYVADGKVYLVHHDFPLQMHRYSGQAARFANAAAKIGKFQDVDAALFDNQGAWTESGDVAKYVAGAISPADFTRIVNILKPCSAAPVTSKADGSMPTADPTCSVDKYIVEDIALGYKVPVKATPTFVVTYKGQRYAPMASSVTWPILKQFFDSLLSQ